MSSNYLTEDDLDDIQRVSDDKNSIRAVVEEMIAREIRKDRDAEHNPWGD